MAATAAAANSWRGEPAARLGLAHLDVEGDEWHVLQGARAAIAATPCAGGRSAELSAALHALFVRYADAARLITGRGLRVHELRAALASADVRFGLGAMADATEAFEAILLSVIDTWPAAGAAFSRCSAVLEVPGGARIGRPGLWGAGWCPPHT